MTTNGPTKRTESAATKTVKISPPTPGSAANRAETKCHRNFYRRCHGIAYVLMKNIPRISQVALSAGTDAWKRETIQQVDVHGGRPCSARNKIKSPKSGREKSFGESSEIRDAITISIALSNPSRYLSLVCRVVYEVLHNGRLQNEIAFQKNNFWRLKKTRFISFPPTYLLL